MEIKNSKKVQKFKSVEDMYLNYSFDTKSNVDNNSIVNNSVDDIGEVDDIVDEFDEFDGEHDEDFDKAYDKEFVSSENDWSTMDNFIEVKSEQSVSDKWW